ncbi:hypothetical protein AB3S75_016709 [Citrus x aurantiifolia]
MQGIWESSNLLPLEISEPQVFNVNLSVMFLQESSALQGLNSNLDEVCGRLLEMKPFPIFRESFAEVRRKERRKRVMMNPSSQDAYSLETRGLALIANKQDDGHVSQSREKVGCDYCNNPITLVKLVGTYTTSHLTRN